MPRQARVVAVGVPHHITQRGNNRQHVFLSDEDRRAYLQILRANCDDCGLRTLGRCLMTNHVHLIAIPRHPTSMAFALRRAHSRYAQQFNRRYGRSGRFWQGRYSSCALGPGHLWAVLASVDLNPVRASMVGSPELYPWSSAAAHLGHREQDPLLDRASWEQLAENPKQWADALATGVEQSLANRLRESTRTGAPLCDDAFLEKLEASHGRSLALRGRGRPPKKKVATASA